MSTYLLDYYSTIKLIGNHGNLTADIFNGNLATNTNGVYSAVRISQFTLFCVRSEIENMVATHRKPWLDAFDLSFWQLSKIGGIKSIDDNVMKCWSELRNGFKCKDTTLPSYRHSDFELTLAMALQLAMPLVTSAPSKYYELVEKNFENLTVIYA